jgi:hypothetical protein
MEKTQTYPNNTNTKVSVGQNGIIEKIRDSQSLPPKEWIISDDQNSRSFAQKFQIKKIFRAKSMGF